MFKIAVFLAAVIAMCSGDVTVVSFVDSTALLATNGSLYCETTGVFGLDTLNFKKSDGTIIASAHTLQVADATKYSFHATDKYRLNILNVATTDEGTYTCEHSGAGGTKTATFTVAAAPSYTWLYWPNNQTWTEQGVAAKLTCEASSARPPATFRWFKGTTDVTSTAVYTAGAVDTNGYGTAQSYLDLTPTWDDEDAEYTCHTDLATLTSVSTNSIKVSFSGSATVVASITMLFAALLATKM